MCYQWHCWYAEKGSTQDPAAQVQMLGAKGQIVLALGQLVERCAQLQMESEEESGWLHDSVLYM